MAKINAPKVSQEKVGRPDDRAKASMAELLSMVREAADRIRDSIYYSPCPYSAELSASTGQQVYLKLENLQMTGAYKERGALNKILLLSAEEKERGFVAFHRDWMKDVNVGDRPLPGEAATELTGAAFQGEYEPVTVSILPLRDLGNVSLTVTDLRGPGTIPAASIDIGYVQYRITRVTGEGSVYTIAPRDRP